MDEKIKKKLDEKMKMRFGSRILDFFKLIPPTSQANQPCYDKYGRYLGWYSRSMASALFAFCKDKDGDWCVLASERGIEAADFRGMWNCPCGYLDRDATTKECAVRECFEETGIRLPISSLTFIAYEDDPITANRQNVTFRFAAKIEDKFTDDFKFSKKGNEGEEVGEIKWIKVKDISNYEWAFNHDKRIKEIYLKNIF